MNEQTIIEKAVEVAGGVAALAGRVGVSSQAVSQWLSGVTRPSLENAKAVEAATEGAVRWRDIRPDIARLVDSTAA